MTLGKGWGSSGNRSPSTLGRRVQHVKDRFALSSVQLGITLPRPPLGFLR